MRIRLMKMFDSIFGRLATSLLVAPATGAQPDAFANILLIRPGGIGDAVWLLPAINALKATYPDVAIDVLAEKRNSAAFELSPHVRAVLHYDKPLELLCVLRNNYDVVIDTEQWHRLSAVVARMTGAPLLIGFGTNRRSRLLTHPVEYSHDMFEPDSFLSLLVELDISPARIHVPFLTALFQATVSAGYYLGGMAGKPFVVVFPGASISERRWGVEKFRRLVERLAACDVAIVVVGGKEDKGLGDQIVSNSGGVNLAGKTSLQETVAIIERGRLLVSGDSGILHIAVGLGVPTVSLFGPGREKKWAPRGDNHIVINKHLPCSPCTTFGYTPKCPINARCMTEISVDEVEQAVLTLLARKKFDRPQQKS